MVDGFYKIPVYKNSPAFFERAIPVSPLQRITDAVRQSIQHLGAQHVSFVVTQKKEARERMATIVGGKPAIAIAPVFITFIIDMYKTDRVIKSFGREQHAHLNTEAIFSSIVHAGISLSAAAEAARTAGIGVLPVCEIIHNPSYIIQLLNLPRLTFPIAGLALGFVKSSAPSDVFISTLNTKHEERYSSVYSVSENDSLSPCESMTESDFPDNFICHHDAFKNNFVRAAMVKQGFDFKY